MITHLVLFKPRRDLTDAARESLVVAFRQALEAIPTVRAVRIGRRVVHGAGYEQQAPDAADFMTAIDFDDVGGLQTYLAHPAHAALGARFRESLESALIFDFDAGGAERLAEFLERRS